MTNTCALQLNSYTHSPNPFPHSIPTLKIPATSLHLKLTPTTTRATTLSSTKTSTNFSLTTTCRSKAAKNTNSSSVDDLIEKNPSCTVPRWVFIGGASLGLAFLIMGVDGQQEALAFGPEGPLVEEFWDNMRRYGLYALTVSTGAIYTILQPIVELLKNPITAILLVIVLAGGGYLVSQVLNAMVGVSEFSYDYSY